MSRIIALATLTAAFNARYPRAAAQPGTVDSLQASGGVVDSLQAGAVRGFASISGKLQYVRALSHFYVGGELVSGPTDQNTTGDYVQVPEADAKDLVRRGQAELATDAEVAQAQQDAAKPAGKGKS